MALGLEAALGPSVLRSKQVHGLLSVPEDCLTKTDCIKLVGGRPAGINEPREPGQEAAREMLRMVQEASSKDLVICLLSGGGSALLPAPTSPITLENKIAVAATMASAGATIEQLNVVRQQLSEFKGGGLARACRASRLITLCISDVLGDPINLVASGPTVESEATAEDALAILNELKLSEEPGLSQVVRFLQSKKKVPTTPSTKSQFVWLANNATAVDAAGMEAERLGYNHAMHSATSSEGSAEEVGTKLAQMALAMRENNSVAGPNCLITGGEPTVTLAPKNLRGIGGRNQQLALAALQELGDCRGIALLSGGTDGEDGPTDAAGALINSEVACLARELKLDITDTLRRNDAYTFFKACGGLVQTGPTGTNVCDLRVITVDR